MGKLVLPIALFIVIGLIGSISALLTQECSDEKYVFDNSNIVVEGIIKSVEANQIAGQIITILKINVLEYEKGSGVNKISIKVPGGKVGNITEWVEDMPLFTKEDFGVRGRFFLINSTYNNAPANEFVLLCGLWNKIEADCKNYYWFDNEHSECGYKQFCGLYMYSGLQTFESKTQCEKALNETIQTSCEKDEDCPPVVCKMTPCLGFVCVNNKCKFEYELSNGRKAEIKIMPETASQTAIERLGELGFTIQLKEVGKGDEIKPAYELEGEKQGKMLGLFKVEAKIKVYVDAETGEIISIKKPWWSFLASGV